MSERQKNQKRVRADTHVRFGGQTAHPHLRRAPSYNIVIILFIKNNEALGFSYQSLRIMFEARLQSGKFEAQVFLDTFVTTKVSM